MIQELHKAFYSLILVITVAIIACGIFVRFGDYTSCIIMSVVWIFMTVMIYFVIKNQVLIILYSFFNALMAGMAMAIYYLKTDNFEYISVRAVIVILVLLCVNFVVYTIANNYRSAAKWMLLFWIVICGIGGYIWGIDLSIQGSWIVFVAIISFMFNLAVLKYATKENGFDVYKVIKLYSMLEFGSVLFLVIAIITEGDALELLDGVEFKKKKSY